MIIAEISANHCRDLQRAMALVDAAAESGADAVKWQCFDPERMAPPNIRCNGGSWAGRELLGLYREGHLTPEWHEWLMARAHERNIEGFASVFSEGDVDVMRGLGAKTFKIASFECVDLPLIEYASQFGQLIVSIGLAYREEVEAITQRFDCTLMVCSSAYPPNSEDLNLGRIKRLPKPVGFSDHTLGNEASLVALGMGATVFEKHICLEDRKELDSHFALTPSRFKGYAETLKAAAQMTGISFGPTPSEKPYEQFRRSIWVKEDVGEGEPFTVENVARMRPNNGLHPHRWNEVLTKRASRDLAKWTPLKPEHLA